MIDLIFLILNEISLYIPLILGAYISLGMMKLPNLGVEIAYLFGAIVTAKILRVMGGSSSLFSSLTVLALGMLSGAFTALVNAGIVHFIKLPFLLSAIIVMGLFHGVAQYLLGGGGISLHGCSTMFDLFSSFPYSEFGLLFCINGLVILFGYYLFHSQLGYAFAIYGNNPHFFSAYSISKTYVFMSGIMMSNALAGLSGALIAQKTGFADITMSGGILLFCLTVLILGKITSKKPFSLKIPVLGIIFYCILEHSLLLIGIPLHYFTTIQACIVLLVLALYFKKNVHHGIDHLGV